MVTGKNCTIILSFFKTTQIISSDVVEKILDFFNKNPFMKRKLKYVISLLFNKS